MVKKTLAIDWFKVNLRMNFNFIIFFELPITHLTITHHKLIGLLHLN